MAATTGVVQSKHISAFQARFLQTRGLTRPSGEPLYSYRMTKGEFAELESGIKDFLSHALQYSRLAEIVREKYWLPGLFVIYSAEWWRREYDGSGWTWDPILLRLGADPDGWSQSQRSQCVESGLGSWNLGLSQSGGFRFLGSVALQGGLPMKLLAAAQGNIGRVLSRALQLASSSHAGEAEVEEWIRSLAAYLPHTYRQTEIFRLLAQVVTTVLSLKAKAELNSPEGAIQRLDATVPEWRARFPLPVEDDQAQGLLEQLVRDAASVQTERTRATTLVNRRLERQEDGNWQVLADVRLPEYLQTSEIISLLGLRADSTLPRSMVLRFGQGPLAVDVGARRLTGRDTYLLERRLPEFVGEDAVGEQFVSMISPDKPISTATLKRGDPLDPNLPWLFEDVEKDSAKFVRQGSGAVASTYGVVCVPSDWFAVEPSDSESLVAGTVPVFGRTVFRFKGLIRVSDATGTVFRFRSGQASADDEQLGWMGERANDVEFISPRLGFRGNPRLCRVTPEGSSHNVHSPVSWRFAAEKYFSPAGLVGPVEAIWPATGDVQFRSRMVLLGNAGLVSAKAGDSPATGTLVFPGWKLAGAMCRTPDVCITTEISADSAFVNFRYEALGSPPEWCELDLLWRSNPSSTTVKVPFPSWGARFFDSRGREIPSGSVIATESVLGVRMVGFLGRSDPAILRLSLWDGKGESESSSFHFIPPSGSNRIELRLIDYLPRIRRMLASADALNAFVTVDLQAGGSGQAFVRVGRYSCELVKNEERSSILLSDSLAADSIDLTSLRLNARAIRLNAPGDEPTVLSPLDKIWGWEFPVKSLEPGPWLIYPAPDCSILFRPMLWTIGSTEPAEFLREYCDLTLPEIMSICDAEVRHARLRSAIDRMAVDFSHSDWTVLEQLLKELSHLPLCTLDIWRFISRSTKGLAALALRAIEFPSGFLSRFSDELPAIWETVPLSDWVEATRSYLKYRQLNPIGTPPLENRIESISALHSSLSALLELAVSIATNKHTPGVRAARAGCIDFFQALFVGTNSPFQALLRECADVTWPAELKHEVLQANIPPLSKFLRFADPHFRDVVVNLPILLGAAAATGTTLGWLDETRLRTIRRYQDFCLEWFMDAYDLTIARCIAEKVIPELGA